MKGNIQKIERIKCGNGNCYIVSNGKNAVLVDTSRTKYRDKILEACKKYDVKLIILTHGHIDHAQNAAYLAKELNAPVAIHQADSPLIRDNMIQSLRAKTFLGKIILAASSKSFKEEELPFFEPDIFLKEADSLEAYGINADIMVLPGHTMGSIAVKVDEQGLVVGDALMNMFWPTVSLLYNDYELMLKSVEKIKALDDITIYFGHGKPVQSSKM